MNMVEKPARSINVRTRVDGSGRVVIPAAIRRALGIGPEGGEIELLDTPDGVLLRPTATPTPQRNDRGLMVVKLGRPVTTEEVAEAIREDRERAHG